MDGVEGVGNDHVNLNLSPGLQREYIGQGKQDISHTHHWFKTELISNHMSATALAAHTALLCYL